MFMQYIENSNVKVLFTFSEFWISMGIIYYHILSGNPLLKCATGRLENIRKHYYVCHFKLFIAEPVYNITVSVFFGALIEPIQGNR